MFGINAVTGRGYNPSVFLHPKGAKIQLPLHRGAEAAPPQGTEFAKVRTAVKPAFSGLPSSVTVQCQSTAPRHLPQGEGKAPRRLCVTSLSKCAATRGTPKHFAAKRQNISHARSAYFTAPQARFHTAAKPPYFTEIKNPAVKRDSFISISVVRTAVKPAFSGLPSSVTVQCQGTAPRHLPQGEGKAPRRLCATSLSKCAATRGTHSFFMRRRRASYTVGVLHTPQACFILTIVLPGSGRCRGTEGK